MKETDLKTLYKRIKSSRKDSNLHMCTIAKYVGVSRQTYSLWEKAIRVPTIQQLDKISKVTGYPIEYFLYPDLDLNEALLLSQLRDKVKKLATLTIDMNKMLNP